MQNEMVFSSIPLSANFKLTNYMVKVFYFFLQRQLEKSIRS